MRNIEIVELLLDKGAKVSAVDKVLFKTHLLITHASIENHHHDNALMLLFSFSDVEDSFLPLLHIFK